MAAYFGWRSSCRPQLASSRSCWRCLTSTETGRGSSYFGPNHSGAGFPAHREHVRLAMSAGWRSGELTRDLDATPTRQAAPQATKLDAYTGILGDRLTTYPELSAIRLYDEVKAAGYVDGITGAYASPNLAAKFVNASHAL